jgi:hypothetical protein
MLSSTHALKLFCNKQGVSLKVEHEDRTDLLVL